MDAKFGEWQPIDSAPKDGSVVLLWTDNYYPVIGWFDGGEGEWQDVWEHAWLHPKQPTLWMPLPLTPAQMAEGDYTSRMGS